MRDGELASLLEHGLDLERHAKEGYLDLLDERPRGNLRREQGVFRFRVLPPIYERFWRPLLARAIFGRRLKSSEEQRIVLDELGVRVDAKVADIGCGTGGYTRRLAQLASDGAVVGLDASEAMIVKAVKRGGGENLSYVRGDACALPFRDSVFDAVCSVGVIHMVDEPMRMLDEMTRVLAPGGRLVVAATYEKSSVPRVRGRLTAFGREELTRGFADRGLVDVRQRVIWRGQFVSGRMPSESEPC